MSGRQRWRRGIVWVAVLTWAVNAYATFWVQDTCGDPGDDGGRAGLPTEMSAGSRSCEPRSSWTNASRWRACSWPRSCFASSDRESEVPELVGAGSRTSSTRHRVRCC